jgi:hypothetical protein
MDDLYDINFKSSDEFCKIYIRYNSIYDSCIVQDLVNYQVTSSTRFWSNVIVRSTSSTDLL